MCVNSQSKATGNQIFLHVVVVAKATLGKLGLEGGCVTQRVVKIKDFFAKFRCYSHRDRCSSYGVDCNRCFGHQGYHYDSTIYVNL